MKMRSHHRFAAGFLFIYLSGYSAKDKGKEAGVYDFLDPVEEGSYEEEIEAEAYYEDALKYSLNLLWQQRFQISMANVQLIQILGQDAPETVEWRKELHAIRDIVEQKSEELRNKLQEKPILNNWTEPIEKSTLERLTKTWVDVGGVFDVHQPKNRTLEFSLMYKWIKNAENETNTAYRKVNWLMARVRKMRPIKL